MVVVVASPPIPKDQVMTIVASMSAGDVWIEVLGAAIFIGGAVLITQPRALYWYFDHSAKRVAESQRCSALTGVCGSTRCTGASSAGCFPRP
jgi:hypothetical protein